MSNFKPPYIGAAFYPEVWDKSETAKDIARMNAAGINMVRLGEYAWSYLEPKEGLYNFKWLHEVIAELENNKIAITLCTPTAAPPEWLIAGYPEVLAVREDKEQCNTDIKRSYCPNSPLYRAFSEKITGLLVKEFSRYKAIVAWQIDNEFGSEFTSCRCTACRTGFQKYLQKKYKTLKNLNAVWGMGRWNQSYNYFERIPLPDKSSVNQPALYYNYKEFISLSFAGFAGIQEKIIRKGSSVSVTTNGMPSLHKIDYQELFKNLDFPTLDLYISEKYLWKYIYEFDWMRPFKNKPYWIMETPSTWAGRLVPDRSFINKSCLRAKMWLAYALGGETVSFWHWRAHWSGQESERISVPRFCGEPTLAEKSLRVVIEELNKTKELLTKTKVKKPESALHLSYQAMWIFDYGVVAGIKYDDELTQFYKVFLDQNIPRDIIFTEADPSGYKTVFSPFLPVINGVLLEKMKDFILKGGTWIVGPLSGFRSAANTAHNESEPGLLEDLFKIQIRHRFLLTGDDSEPVYINWGAMGKVRCRKFAVSIELKGHGKVLAKYSDGPGAGMNAIVEVPFGKGKVVLLGTLPAYEKLKIWINEIAGADKCKIVKTGAEGIVIAERVDAAGKSIAFIIVEHAGKGGLVTLTKSLKNAFTGKKLKKNLKLAPYDVIVLV
ncbi:MAG: beta-galactosidase [Candidatus Firestonebacteria bacterium]|nr:beta-galactosidase [Candidatus Firestonebacteria bacterium]